MRRSKSSQSHDMTDRRRSDYAAPPMWLLQERPLPIQLGYATSRVAVPPPPSPSCIAPSPSPMPMPNYPSSTTFDKTVQRPVIPSKRAAQNRAAQKAFRQRREQYIKELEEKAKRLDECESEIAHLRQDNTHLQDAVRALEAKITHLLQDKPNECIPRKQEASPAAPFPQPHTRMLSHDPAPEQEPYAPPTSLPYMPDTSAPIPMASPSHSNDIWQSGSTDIDLDFDPFFDPGFVVPSSRASHVVHDTRDQVLDDLFAMLQTRQRPQIPMQPVLHATGGDEDGR